VQQFVNHVRLNFVIDGIKAASGAMGDLNGRIRAMRSQSRSSIAQGARAQWVGRAQPNIMAARGFNAQQRDITSNVLPALRAQLAQNKAAQGIQASLAASAQASYTGGLKSQLGKLGLNKTDVNDIVRLKQQAMSGAPIADFGGKMSSIYRGRTAGQVDKIRDVMGKYTQPGKEAIAAQKALNKLKQDELNITKQIKTQTDAATSAGHRAAIHTKAILTMKKHAEQEAIEAHNKTLEALEEQKQSVQEISRQWSSLVFIAQSMVGAIETALEKTRQFREASILARQQFSEEAFRTTSMGMDAFQVGQTYKAISRSAFPNEYKNKIEQFSMFERLFNVEPNQLIPMVSGFKAMYGKGNTPTQKILDQMLATSASSSFDFSGWASITMQGAIPTLNDINASLETTSALLSGISNLGGGPFASGFGLSGISQLMIREGGILNFLTMLGEKLNELSDAERDKAITDLFPSMTKGVGLMILNNMDMFKKLEKDYNNPYKFQSVLLEEKALPVNKIKEISALMGNIGSQFTEVVLGSPVISLLVNGVVEALKSISSLLTSINRSPFWKTVVGLSVGAWSAVKAYRVLIPLIQATTAMIARQVAIQTGASWTSPSGVVMGGKQATNFFTGAPISASSTAALTKLTSIVGYVGLMAGTMLLTYGVLSGYVKSQSEKKSARFSNEMSLLDQLIAKRRDGKIKPEEEQIIKDILAGKYKDKILIDVNVNVSGNTEQPGTEEIARGAKEGVYMALNEALATHI